MATQLYLRDKVTLPFKSVAGALLFCVFLGPLGLLYASSTGGIIMLVIGFVVATSLKPIPILLVWCGACIWGVISANQYNARLLQTLLKTLSDA